MIKQIILLLIIILILCLYVYNEKFSDGVITDNTDIFYKSAIRLRDYQDILSITDSEIKKLKNSGIS